MSFIQTFCVSYCNHSQNRSSLVGWTVCIVLVNISDKRQVLNNIHITYLLNYIIPNFAREMLYNKLKSVASNRSISVSSWIKHSQNALHVYSYQCFCLLYFTNYGTGKVFYMYCIVMSFQIRRLFCFVRTVSDRTIKLRFFTTLKRNVS